MINEILESFPENNFLKIDGFDNAIIGIEEKNMVLIYSVSKCLKILEIDMSETEAAEHFDFNIFGSYLGNKTPLFCWDNF